MRRLVLLLLIALFHFAGGGCSSAGSSTPAPDGGGDGGVAKMTYDEAVRQMRRPPTSARTLPGGDLEATWITEVRGGRKHLILTFGPDRLLKSHREEIR